VAAAAAAIPFLQLHIHLSFHIRALNLPEILEFESIASPTGFLWAKRTDRQGVFPNNASMADAAAEMEKGGLVRTLKDLFAGAAGGVAQVLLGEAPYLSCIGWISLCLCYY
jgi:hypothetical protein